MVWQNSDNLELIDEVNLLLSVADNVKRQNLDTAFKYSSMAINLAESSDLYQQKVDGFKLMAQTSAMLGKNEEGLRYCELMLENAKKLGDKKSDCGFLYGA